MTLGARLVLTRIDGWLILFEERIIKGARVWAARQSYRRRGRTMWLAVTFPDNGCANFYLTSSNIEDAAIIDSIARSFHPKRSSNPSPMCELDRAKK